MEVTVRPHGSWRQEGCPVRRHRRGETWSHERLRSSRASVWSHSENWMCDIELYCMTWVERVASTSNLAGGSSRLNFECLQDMWQGKVKVVPSSAKIQELLVSWAKWGASRAHRFQDVEASRKKRYRRESVREYVRCLMRCGITGSEKWEGEWHEDVICWYAYDNYLNGVDSDTSFSFYVDAFTLSANLSYSIEADVIAHITTIWKSRHTLYSKTATCKRRSKWWSSLETLIKDADSYEITSILMMNTRELWKKKKSK